MKSLVFIVAATLHLAACDGNDPGQPRFDTGQPSLDMEGIDTRVNASADLSVPDSYVSDAAIEAPTPPPSLTRWMSGSADDARVTPNGPGLILMGGGSEPDEAFQWWQPLVNRGDIVVLRVSGSDGYNDYLFTDIGGVDSVETLKVDSRALADDPYVAWQIDHAEGVFLAGGDQWDYLSLWSGTGVQQALQRVHGRDAVLGGTSAGLAVLGDRAFSAENDTVYPDEALANPYNEFMLFEDSFLTLAPLTNTITDSHFRERDRMGRLASFVARMWTDGFDNPVGLGVDESTALLIGPAGREVVGAGAVYELTAANAPDVCAAGVPLEWGTVDVKRMTSTAEDSYTIGVVRGVVEPADPY